jgi:hypothetical protein
MREKKPALWNRGFRLITLPANSHPFSGPDSKLLALQRVEKDQVAGSQSESGPDFSFSGLILE